jgi:membrane protein implicated in regulation of membrane protease activity
MILTLTYISLITGGLLILLMVLSLLGGLDLDFDLGDADVETGDGGGGLGVLKGGLTFISVTSWVIKLVLATEQNPWIAIAIGAISGAVALWLLSYLFKLLLNNEENVNWEMNDAVYQEGKVYLRIPLEGEGIVHVKVKGRIRELKAKTRNEKEIKTGASILVTDVENEYVIVEPVKRNEF